MLALGIRYLTGYAVATHPATRTQAEWPPHPARVYMALAAALFETGEDAAERGALSQLEELGTPDLSVSEAYPRDVVTYYVPPNDMETPANPDKIVAKKIADALNVLPSMRLNRQARTFPRVRPHDEQMWLVWPHAELVADQIVALDRLCGKVTRIGHSSSLVQMWVDERPPATNLRAAEFGEHQLRVVGPGTLAYLEAKFAAREQEEYGKLRAGIAHERGDRKQNMEREFADRFGGRVPNSSRPEISLSSAYTKPRPHATNVSSGTFDGQLLILAGDGPTIGLESTWQLITALRDTILKTCEPTPEWLSGHTLDGGVSQQPHLALMPLGFVDHPHADGHIMGYALALPKNVPLRDRAGALRGLFFERSGEPRTIELKSGSLGKWKLTRELQYFATSLQPETWTRPSKLWATVTPISLDRQPKVERVKDREQWSIEAAEIIAEGCERQGLPRPIAIDVDKTSWFRGAPRAIGGKSSGFPLMPAKPGRPMRQQVHALLRFDAEIAGPLLLGAGRYRGYGVCRPKQDVWA